MTYTGIKTDSNDEDKCQQQEKNEFAGVDDKSSNTEEASKIESEEKITEWGKRATANSEAERAGKQ